LFHQKRYKPFKFKSKLNNDKLSNFDYNSKNNDYYKIEGSPYEIKHKFDGFRTTIGANKGIKETLHTALEEFKNRSDQGASNKLIMIIVLILFVIFLLIIDFDLSIFFSK